MRRSVFVSAETLSSASELFCTGPRHIPPNLSACDFASLQTLHTSASVYHRLAHFKNVSKIRLGLILKLVPLKPTILWWFILHRQARDSRMWLVSHVLHDLFASLHVDVCAIPISYWACWFSGTSLFTPLIAVVHWLLARVMQTSARLSSVTPSLLLFRIALMHSLWSYKNVYKPSYLFYCN